MASRLIAPDGTILMDGSNPDSPLYGPAYWFDWIDEPSWPVVALHQFTGGHHCCHLYWFLTRKPPYTIISGLNAGDRDAAFTDVDGDGVNELKTLDGLFRYWHSSYGDSPAPELIWRVSSRGATLARDLMRGRGPEKIERAEAVEEIRRNAHYSGRDYPVLWRGWWLDPRLWGMATEIYYGGGSLDEARAFFDAAWHPDIPEPDAFWRNIVELWKCSPYGVRGSRCE